MGMVSKKKRYNFIYEKSKNTVQQFLLKMFGISTKRVRQICTFVGTQPYLNIRQIPSNLWEQSIISIQNKKYLGSQFRFSIKENIKRYSSIGCFRGFRHVAKLPVRGQRTHTNSKTCRKKKLIK